MNGPFSFLRRVVEHHIEDYFNIIVVKFLIRYLSSEPSLLNSFSEL